MDDVVLALQPDPARYTWPRFLEDVAMRYGDRVAIRYEGRDWTYREVHALAREFAKGLVACGVVKGARLGLLCANRPEWVVAAFAASWTGAVLVPVNTFATSGERDFILRHGDVSLLLAQEVLLKHRFVDDLVADHPTIAAARPGHIHCEELPQLRRVACFDLAEARGAVEPAAAIVAAGESVSDTLLDAIADEISPVDHALVIYTSGTTAQPKGVIHRHRAVVIQAWRFAELMRLSPEDRVFTAQPFFWTAGISMSLGATFAAGAMLVLEERFDAGSALETIERERVTTVHAWPHQEKSLAEHPDALRRDLGSVRHVEFANPLARKIPLQEDTWGMYGSYGLTETFTLATALPADAAPALRHGTHGEVLPGNELRIVEPDSGAPLPQGERGEIALKGRTMMAGYAKVAPEAAFDGDGWFRTRDGGYLDAEGRLHWTGRLSHLIKTGGANVSPLEIESHLVDEPGVKAAHAVGIEHPTLGEAIVLCLVPTAEGAAPDADAVRAKLRERLASYKRPRVVMEIPPDVVAYTGSQKVQLDPLRAYVQARLEENRVEIAGFVYGGS